MNVVEGQPARRGHQHDIKIGQRRMIAEPVQPRPSQAGAAIPVIAVDRLILQLPAALRDRRAQLAICDQTIDPSNATGKQL